MFTKAAIALAMIVAIGSGALAANNESPSATDVCSHAPANAVTDVKCDL